MEDFLFRADKLTMANKALLHNNRYLLRWLQVINKMMIISVLSVYEGKEA